MKQILLLMLIATTLANCSSQQKTGQVQQGMTHLMGDFRKYKKGYEAKQAEKKPVNPSGSSSKTVSPQEFYKEQAGGYRPGQ